ncbi:MAG: DEAD/DEAH box helicase, partial [Chloroflexota bacterium]|nr:DEAD/DEAH box helicase [Chloroflexota bacterium]
KGPMGLVWAETVAQRANKPVLILTPLAVAPQLAREAARFGIDAARSHRGEITAPVVIANYDRLHLFDPDQFGGVVCDESSILKSFDGTRRRQITEFLRRTEYRLLATATAAPNDYVELGTSSEALGYLGHMDMLSRFFTNGQKTNDPRRRWSQAEWRFKGHAESAFWRWVVSWARAMRKPSDLGYPDDGFLLPPLVTQEHTVTTNAPRAGMLFDLPARGFHEEREERRRTIVERCERAAALVTGTEQPAVIWGHLNDEGDHLARMIPDAVQVAGKDCDEAKEAAFVGFAAGDIRVLITKPVIGAWGLNWQHCAHVVTFATHSYEQYYQAVRRCWRFGQARSVVVDTVTTEGEAEVMENLRRKEEQANRMFSALVDHMRDALTVRRTESFAQSVEVPAWMAS